MQQPVKVEELDAYQQMEKARGEHVSIAEKLERKHDAELIQRVMEAVEPMINDLQGQINFLHNALEGATKTLKADVRNLTNIATTQSELTKSQGDVIGRCLDLMKTMDGAQK